ncbi:MAG: AsmA family protein, partial [Notoacmeibacter sp.]|nr:AsmA family protein [Notoacmeibacter sp.]
IEQGVARIQKATLTTPVRQVRLVGLIPLAGRSLAIAGTVTPLGENPADGDALSFFAGGSWNAPLISPVLAPNLTPQ